MEEEDPPAAAAAVAAAVVGSCEVDRSSPKIFLPHRSREGYSTTIIFASFVGRIPVEEPPHLHAGLFEAEIRKYRLLRCSLFRSLPFWPLHTKVNWFLSTAYKIDSLISGENPAN